MVKFGSILALAGMASGLHIDFKRYVDDKCAPEHHLRKTTDMHPNTCKTFTRNEVGYHAFNFHVTDDHEFYDSPDHICKLIAYDDDNCHGNSRTLADLKGQEDVCQALPANFEGRSVRFQCDDKPDPEPKTLSTKPTVKVNVKIAPSTTQIETEPFTTVTVVPEKKHHRHTVCHVEDDDE